MSTLPLASRYRFRTAPGPRAGIGYATARRAGQSRAGARWLRLARNARRPLEELDDEDPQGTAEGCDPLVAASILTDLSTAIATARPVGAGSCMNATARLDILVGNAGVAGPPPRRSGIIEPEAVERDRNMAVNCHPRIFSSVIRCMEPCL